MGEVWRAQHVTVGHTVALKLVAATQNDGGDTLRRFLREAQAAAALRSSHVVQVFDQGVEGAAAYIAMELLEGESLGDRLARVKRLSPLETAQIIRDVVRGLGKAHDIGIVHRDLKPHNIFLAQVDGREVVKILDFGIAKLTTDQRNAFLQTNSAGAIGTPAYMSPEQILGDRPLDWRSDLWQLAIIAYECLVGRLPVEANTLGELFMKICSAPMPVPSQSCPVPPGFDLWFARATQRDPAQRFASAKELADALTTVLAPGLGELELGTMSGSSTSVAARSLRGASSFGTHMIAIALAIGVFGVGVGLWFALRSRDASVAAAPPAASASAVPAVSASAAPLASASAAAAASASAAPAASASAAPLASASAAPHVTAAPVAKPIRGTSSTGGKDWGF